MQDLQQADAALAGAFRGVFDQHRFAGERLFHPELAASLAGDAGALLVQRFDLHRQAGAGRIFFWPPAGRLTSGTLHSGHHFRKFAATVPKSVKYNIDSV